MVNIHDIRPGNLLIHKKVGVTLVVKVEKNQEDPDKSIIYGMDYDDQIYSGPCEDWFYFWTKLKTK